MDIKEIHEIITNKYGKDKVGEIEEFNNTRFNISINRFNIKVPNDCCVVLCQDIGGEDFDFFIIEGSADDVCEGVTIDEHMKGEKVLKFIDLLYE